MTSRAITVAFDGGALMANTPGSLAGSLRNSLEMSPEVLVRLGSNSSQTHFDISFHPSRENN